MQRCGCMAFYVLALYDGVAALGRHFRYCKILIVAVFGLKQCVGAVVVSLHQDSVSITRPMGPHIHNKIETIICLVFVKDSI